MKWSLWFHPWIHDKMYEYQESFSIHSCIHSRNVSDVNYHLVLCCSGIGNVNTLEHPLQGANFRFKAFLSIVGVCDITMMTTYS
jgi:hypothetical protein